MSNKGAISPKKSSNGTGLDPTAGTIDIKDFFASREREKHQLLKSLNHSNFIAIVGNPGMGKTSFINHEVIPVLQDGYALRSSKSWKIVSFRPGNKPIEALSMALSSLEIMSDQSQSKVDPNLNFKFQDTLTKKKYGIIEVIEKYEVIEDSNLLLFIDNLDDLIYYATDGESELDEFVERLIEVTQQTAYPIYVITTLRTDIASSFSIYPRLAELINKHQFILGDIGVGNLVEVFSKISNTNHLNFSPDYIKNVKDHLKDNKPALGSIKHAIMRSIVKSRELGSNTVELSHLDAIGGLEHSVAHQLKSIYDLFPPHEQLLTKRTFQALTGAKEVGDYLILPRSIEEIATITNATSDEIIQIVTPFMTSNSGILEVYQTQGIIERLENLNAEHKGRSALTVYSEVILSRDEIVQSVDLLRSWVDEEHENAGVYHDLNRSVMNNDHLYEGEKFKETKLWYEQVQPHKGWARRYGINFDAVDSFYQQCLLKQQKKEDDLNAEENSRTQKAKRTRIIVAVFSISLLILLVWASIEGNRATRAINVSRKLKDSAELAKAEADTARIIANLAIAKADTAKRQARLDKVRANIAIARAGVDSAKAAQALSLAEIATTKAKEKEGELIISNAKLAENEKRAKLLEIEQEATKKENDYLNALQQITKSLEGFKKTLKNSSDDFVKFNAAKDIGGLYLAYSTLIQENEGVLDSFPGLTERVKKEVFNGMQKAYQEANKKSPLKVITTSVSLAKQKKENNVLIVANGRMPKVYKYAMTKKSLDTLKENVGRDLSELGAYKMRFNQSGDKFMISHLPVESKKRYVSWYDNKGRHLQKIELESAVLAIYPFKESSFLAVDQQANLWLMKDQQKNEINFPKPVRIFSNKGNTSTNIENNLRGVSYDDESGMMIMASLSSGIIQLELLKNDSVKLVSQIKTNIAVNDITALKYLAKKQLLVIGNRKGQLAFYKIVSDQLELKEQFFLEHANNINVLETNQSESVLISASRDGIINVWDLVEFKTNYQPLKFEQADAIREVAFADEETILVSSSTEGLKGGNLGQVSIILLDFERMGNELIELLDQQTN